MRLATSRFTKPPLSAEFAYSSQWVYVATAIALTAIFALDRVVAYAPVQHLYYLPIIFAALRFGRKGGLAVSIAAIILYHLANKSLLGYYYGESDIIQIALFVGVGVITAKLKDDAHRLHVLAMTDDLTGLHNLRSFEGHLARMVGGGKTPLSLLVLDVDKLKSLNDRYGHICGAEAVRTVGSFIALHIPEDAVACRYGGDEFAIALPRCSILQAQVIASQIRQAVYTASTVLGGHTMPAGTLSISVGVATLSAVRDQKDAEALFRAADQALYVAKANGRNCIYAGS